MINSTIPKGKKFFTQQKGIKSHLNDSPNRSKKATWWTDFAFTSSSIFQHVQGINRPQNKNFYPAQETFKN